jgi:hypothetical protein
MNKSLSAILRDGAALVERVTSYMTTTKRGVAGTGNKDIREKIIAPMVAVFPFEQMVRMIEFLH